MWLPHLRTVFEQAPAGAVYVIGRYREGANLNPHFRRIIKRAGLSVWPRTWHNLRATRQTELASDYPCTPFVPGSATPRRSRRGTTCK